MSTTEHEPIILEQGIEIIPPNPDKVLGYVMTQVTAACAELDRSQADVSNYERLELVQTASALLLKALKAYEAYNNPPSVVYGDTLSRHNSFFEKHWKPD